MTFSTPEKGAEECLDYDEFDQADEMSKLQQNYRTSKTLAEIGNRDPDTDSFASSTKEQVPLSLDQLTAKGVDIRQASAQLSRPHKPTGNLKIYAVGKPHGSQRSLAAKTSCHGDCAVLVSGTSQWVTPQSASMDKAGRVGAPRFKRPSTAQATLRIHSDRSAGASWLQGASLSNQGGSVSLRSPAEQTQNQLLQLQESQRRCQELQAHNSVLKHALSADELRVRQARPRTAHIPRTAVKLSRCHSAMVPSALADRVDAQQSGLQGQVAGLKLQLMSANTQIQTLTEQLTSEASSRRVAEQQRRHLWESQLMNHHQHQQQSLTKEESHQQLLQQVQSHDKQQQKLVQKVQCLEQQNQELSQELSSSREASQMLTQQCSQLQQQLQASSDSHKQLKEKLSATEQCKVQEDQALLDRSTEHSQEHLLQQLHSLQAQLSAAQHSTSQQQADSKCEVESHTAVQRELRDQQQLHKQQQQKLQQQLTESQRQHQTSVQLLAKQAADLTVLRNQSQQVNMTNQVLSAKLSHLETLSAAASAKNDALTLSEASLRLQLDQAAQRHDMLVLQHQQELKQAQQKPKTADASIQASLAHAGHAVACQAGAQHSTLQALQAQLASLQCKHADSVKELAAAASQNESVHSQLAESQKEQWKLTASQQEAEAAREVAEAAQEAAGAGLAEAKHSMALLQEQLASQHTQMDRLQAEVTQRAAVHAAQAEAQQEEVRSLRGQLAELKQKLAGVKQHPWAGRQPGTGAGRPHSALPAGQHSSSGKEWQQLKEHMGEIDRLQSNVARDAAAMQAMGVLVQAKALKLDMPGSRPSSAGASLTQTIRLQQQVKQLQMRLQEAQAK
ncbi:hypothetical protein ABBQ38_012405 [Trebouxia sp. C0009 RCD-2024]